MLHSLSLGCPPTWGEAMRTGAIVILLVLILSGLAAGARADEHTWVVLSSPDLDDRIERQLNVLAAHDQALIRILNGSAEGARVVPEEGGLTIELRREKRVETFLDTLKREAGTTEIAPTAALAEDGYVIEASYPRAAALNRLRITANTWRGFHDALLRVPDLLALSPSRLSTELLPHPQSVRIGGNGLNDVVADFPSFPERGVVEGFYGTPWTHQDRIDILRFEGAHGMNRSEEHTSELQ